MAGAFIESLTPSERASLEQLAESGFAPAVRQIPALDAAAVGRILRLCGEPAFGIKFSVGYAEGFVAGFLDGARLWRDEFQAMLRLVGVGTVVSVAEFFVRPLTEDDPEGLLPQSKKALAKLNSLRTLRPVLLWLDAVDPEEALNTLRQLIPSADEMLEIIVLAGRDWLLNLCEKARDAVGLGEQCGRLFGRLAIELIRADVEPFSFGLAGTLEHETITPDEVRP